MVYATYSAAQAVTRANAVTKWQTAMCLNFVMNCLTTIPAGLYDANAAWAAAKQKEYGTPPAGAPVYFAGYTHGHIAISLGGGWIRSTDVPYATAKGTLAPVGRINIGDIEREWGIKYRGWSRDYAGQIIRGLEKTNTDYSPIPPIPNPTPTPAPAPQEDDMLSTEAQTWIEARMDAHDAYIISAIKSQLPDEVWAFPVPKPGDSGGVWPAKTGLWSANTYAYAASNNRPILDLIGQVKAALPGLPDDGDVAALKAQLDELKALVDALPKA